jgi:hypothetical protein
VPLRALECCAALCWSQWTLLRALPQMGCTESGVQLVASGYFFLMHVWYCEEIGGMGSKRTQSPGVDWEGSLTPGLSPKLTLPALQDKYTC